MWLRVFDGRTRWFRTSAVVCIRPTPLRGDASSRRRCRSGRGIVSASRVCRLATRPVLERRTDRERARQAVRLLVRQGARNRCRFGKAPMAVVGTGRPCFAIVLERHERAGRCAVDAG